MIMAVEGGIIAPENRHPSVDEGLTLAGKRGYFVRTKKKGGLPMPLTAEEKETFHKCCEGIRHNMEHLKEL